MNALIIYQNILFMIIGKAIPITTEEPTNTQSLLLTLKKVCKINPRNKIPKTIIIWAASIPMANSIKGKILSSSFPISNLK